MGMNRPYFRNLRVDQNFEGTGEYMIQQMPRTRNFNSFAAGASGPYHPSSIAIYQIGNILELQAPEGMSQAKKDCQLWIVSEWMIQNARGLLEFVTQYFTEKGGIIRVNQVEGVEFRTVSERWDFWMQRLPIRAREYGVSNDVAQHVSNTLISMTNAKNGPPNAQG